MTDAENSAEDQTASRFEGENQHGWAPDVGSDSNTAAEGGERAWDPSNADQSGPGRIISDEERDGVPPTDTTAATPLGVGESMTRRGEDVGGDDDRTEQGRQGRSDRPYGKSDPEQNTGVAPQDSGEDSETYLTGDQGG
jgi:hypothetical protein